MRGKKTEVPRGRRILPPDCPQIQDCNRFSLVLLPAGLPCRFCTCWPPQLCEALSLHIYIYIYAYTYTHIQINRTSQVAQWERICLPIQETQVQFLGQEDPLEKEMATHSSILTWEIPWRSQESQTQLSDEITTYIYTYISIRICIHVYIHGTICAY